MSTYSLPHTAPSDFKSVFEQTPGLYVLLDPNLKIVAVTNELLSAANTTRHRMIGRNFFDVFPKHIDRRAPISHPVFDHTGATRFFIYKLRDRSEFARPSPEQNQLRKTDVPISAVLREVISAFEPQARAKRIGLQIAIDENLPAVISTDRSKIMQILTQLVSNSIKFSERGQIAVKVGPFSAKEKSKVLFSVSDEGIGIDPRFVATLFSTPTQDSDSALPGLGGIGLAHARKLARILNGDLWLERTGRQGSTFSFYIPREASQPKEATSVSVRTNDKPLLGSHILIIDDSLDNQILAQRFLERAGAIVIIANDGSEGIKKAIKTSPDLILMDIQMPVVDGYTATVALRANGFRNPIIALTANSMRADRDRTLLAGCNGHVAKPIEPKVLVAEVKKALRERSGRSTRSSAFPVL